MMEKSEQNKVQSLFYELEQQRMWALTRCTILAGQLADANTEIDSLKAKIEELNKPKSKRKHDPKDNTAGQS